MAYCPECKGKIEDNVEFCSHCGKRIIAGDTLEKIVTKTSTWQKIIIAVGVIILIAIGFTFQGAEKREDESAQRLFEGPTREIVKNFSEHSGLTSMYGEPQFRLTAETHGAQLTILYPQGQMSNLQASVLGQAICTALARTYVDKGYAPRNMSVTIASKTGDKAYIYGKAVLNGNLDKLMWVPEAPVKR